MTALLAWAGSIVAFFLAGYCYALCRSLTGAEDKAG